MRRFFVRGDTHGNFDFLPTFCEMYNTTTEDILIILGDVGIHYYGAKSARERAMKSHIQKQPITLFCIRGNHEDRPTARNVTEVDVGLGETVYVEEGMENVWYAKDGGIYDFNGQKILTIGGAYSVDKFYRITMGWRWFSDEQLTQEEMLAISEKVAGQHFNHIMSHTCPIGWMPTDLFLKSINQATVDNSMERWLWHLEPTITYDHWWFGHYHADRMDVCGDGKVHMLMYDIIALEDV